jgi:hypothetical protein
LLIFQATLVDRGAAGPLNAKLIDLFASSARRRTCVGRNVAAASAWPALSGKQRDDASSRWAANVRAKKWSLWERQERLSVERWSLSSMSELWRVAMHVA